MTAVAVAVGTGVQLICDGCGDLAVANGCGLHDADADVVYVAVAEVGWTGSAFARGPHRCSGCSSRIPVARRSAERVTGDAPPTGRVSRHSLSSVSLVRVAGDVDTEVVAELRTALETALAEHPRIIMDLTGAATIDSVGLGTVVRARQAARRRGGDLLLAAPSRFVQTVLHTMRLDGAFPTFDTVPQAMSAARAVAPVAAADRR
ncbi:STAS domain-containing protein [Jidongwangia harbinensis]|uniref:STAS domain-containing protein n=1 Tax=Jidongwangia harbinensis TaxID=2878561 RepID=UPI001CD9B38D|nr:STAS domain-containing protein [Jidongwangia harbinensis]MCA2213921.1 STAS domain-containing protein [Jidongwangia harbinensis]